MIRLGLFGGTFDPVHYGHLRAVDGARRELDLPRVLMLPNPHPPHKLADPLTPYPHRKEMLRLALAAFPGMEVADYEEGAAGPGYTTDTVRRVIAALPVDEDRELWLIIGMDSMIELPRWKDPEALFRDVKVAVLPRPGYPPERVLPDYLARVRLLQTPLIDISATEIRNRIRNGVAADEWLSPSVLQYIQLHGLYR